MTNPKSEKYPEAVIKYLRKQSLDKWRLEGAENKLFNTIIVIPAIREYGNIKPLLNSLAKNDAEHLSETLAIFVINNSPVSSEEIKENNRKTLVMLRGIIRKNEGGKDRFIDKMINSRVNIGLVDASRKSFELPVKDAGVGLARKIGIDLGLRRLNYGDRKTKKIFVSLDADCTVAGNYLKEIRDRFNNSPFKAGYINFQHKLNGPEEKKLAIICYELFLRYYVISLKIAGSPYAYPAIGSTITFDYESYIKIGGMNKLKAGEDFYFLEKMAKSTPLSYIDGTIVYPSGRGSWRVPFGTGQRVKRYLSRIQDEYLLYSFQTFILLKDWLNIFNNKEILSADEYLSKAGKLHPVLLEFLMETKFKESWDKILIHSKTESQINRQKLLWFDAFKTLKLIHNLRNKAFPMQEMFDTLDETLGYLNLTVPLRSRGNRIPPIHEQMHYLYLLRDLT